MKILIFLFGILVFTSCNNNDDDNTTEQNQYETIGEWHLITYRCCLFESYEYTDEITWIFNPDNTIDIAIDSGTNVSSNMPFNSSGNYTYNINENEDRDEIIIDGITYYYLTSNTGTQLIIEDEIGFSADGLLLLFEKIE
ncbi:hypothetical protein [Sediminibacter sp. Hel_I_10]|uniref:hypothetical protein n=1 Tax=Sediminibacter sp. Hel_I_10 TaxID=1392490 RepID=UPI00047D582B|nr:hypothetical protein [Sediminibacter sp. Hel_I_10]